MSDAFYIYITDLKKGESETSSNMSDAFYIYITDLKKRESETTSNMSDAFYIYITDLKKRESETTSNMSDAFYIYITDLKKVESETASNQTDASLASHNNTSVQLDSSEHLSHVATSLQLSQRETNSVEQHNPRETTVTALQQKSSNTRRDTSLEYAHDVSPPPTKHAPVTSVKLDVLVGDEKENVCVSLSCSILPVIKDRGENKHVDADLASCCLLAANQPRSAVRVLHKNGSIITLDTPPGSQHSSSSPTKPRRTVQDDDSIDDLLPRHMSVFSKPVSSKFNKYSDTRKLDSADIQRVNSLCELRDTSNIVPSGSPREGTNGDVVDDVCDMLCSDSLQFTDSSDSSLFQRDECEFNRCDTDWSYCLHNKPCQNGLHSCHSDRQVENTLHCCHSNKPGEFGLHCYYGDATPSFHTESSPQFSCEISDHSPSDNPRIELLGGEHKAECSSLSKFVIEDTITFTDESESFAN